ncbi:MAG TPA: hypothetical protein ENF50_00905 [Archaeoglobus veneficus]|nr:hypothetical protein [Archaeoglobus veneficus]
MKKRVAAGILFAITLFAAIYGISMVVAMPHQLSVAYGSSWIQPTAFSTLGIHPMGDEGGGGRPFSNGGP